MICDREQSQWNTYWKHACGKMDCFNHVLQPNQ